MSRHQPFRGWLSDATRALALVPVVTSSESEALRAVQILRVDLAIVDCLGLAEGECVQLVASLRSLSAKQPLKIIRIVGPIWRFMQGLGDAKPDCAGIDLPWPIGMDSFKRAIEEVLLAWPDDPPSIP